MIVWLDNYDNHGGAINENYGRELLELFSMGVGNYTENDIKEASRAFAGWTIGNTEYMVLTVASHGISISVTKTMTIMRRHFWASLATSTVRTS